MTIAPETTDWRTARRADKAAEAEQRREDERLRAALAREERAFREEQAATRRAADDERKRELSAQRRKDKAAAAAQRSTRWRKRVRAVRENGDVTATVAVMVCGMVPALVAQYQALTGMGLGLLLGCLLPVMLELAAWAATAGEARALREHRRVAPYRLAVWTFATLAAGVNAWHGAHDYGPLGGIILAASSIAPVALWHMVMAGRHNAKARRTKAEIAAERKARAEAKERAAHTKARRRHHPKVAAVADRLLSAAPFGTLTADDAWAQAWKAVHGAEAPGMTAELYAASAAARHRLGAAFDLSPEEQQEIRTGLLESFYGPAHRPVPVLGKVSPLARRAAKKAQVTDQIPPADADTEAKPARKARPKPPRRRKGDTAPYHPAARTAARETALRTAN